MDRTNHLNYGGLAIIVLATGLVISVIIISLQAAFHKGAISASESTLLSTILGGIIGAVASYVGTHVARNGSNGNN